MKFWHSWFGKARKGRSRPSTQARQRHRFFPRLEALEDRSLPNATQLYALGAGPGGSARVQVFNTSTGLKIADFDAFPGFHGGVTVAVGDIDGRGFDDVIVGAGPGGGPHVKVYKSIVTGGQITGIATSPIASFFAFDPNFHGGVYVAAGDVDVSNDTFTPGEGATAVGLRQEIVVGAGAGGGPHVKIFENSNTTIGNITINPNSPIASFFPFAMNFHGGVRVAAGNLDKVPVTGPAFPFGGAGTVDYTSTDALSGAEVVVAAGPGGGPHVKVYRAKYTTAGSVIPTSFIPFIGPPGTIVSPAKGFSLDTANPVASFFAYNLNFHGGVFVSVGNVSATGNPEIITGAGDGGGPHVLAFNPTYTGNKATGVNTAVPGASFLAFNADFHGGVRGGSFGKTIVAGTGPGSSAVETFVITSTGVKQTPVGGVFDVLFNNGVYVS